MKNTFSFPLPQLDTVLKPSAVVSMCGLVSVPRSCAAWQLDEPLDEADWLPVFSHTSSMFEEYRMVLHTPTSYVPGQLPPDRIPNFRETEEESARLVEVTSRCPKGTS